MESNDGRRKLNPERPGLKLRAEFQRQLDARVVAGVEALRPYKVALGLEIPDRRFPGDGDQRGYEILAEQLVDPSKDFEGYYKVKLALMAVRSTIVHKDGGGDRIDPDVWDLIMEP